MAGSRCETCSKKKNYRHKDSNGRCNEHSLHLDRDLPLISAAIGASPRDAKDSNLFAQLCVANFPHKIDRIPTGVTHIYKSVDLRPIWVRNTPAPAPIGKCFKVGISRMCHLPSQAGIEICVVDLRSSRGLAPSCVSCIRSMAKRVLTKMMVCAEGPEVAAIF